MIRHYRMDGQEPWSLNHAYIMNWYAKSRKLNPDAAKVGEDFVDVMREKDEAEYGGPLKASLYDFSWIFWYPPKKFFLKDGKTVKRSGGSKDVTNSFKVIEDKIMKYLESNDVLVIGVSGFKFPSWDEEPHIDIFLSPAGVLMNHHLSGMLQRLESEGCPTLKDPYTVLTSTR